MRGPHSAPALCCGEERARERERDRITTAALSSSVRLGLLTDGRRAIPWEGRRQRERDEKEGTREETQLRPIHRVSEEDASWFCPHSRILLRSYKRAQLGPLPETPQKKCFSIQRTTATTTLAASLSGNAADPKRGAVSSSAPALYSSMYYCTVL